MMLNSAVNETNNVAGQSLACLERLETMLGINDTVSFNDKMLNDITLNELRVRMCQHI